MHSIGHIIEHVRNWLSTGTGSELFIKRALVVTVTILIIYRLGYAVGKLLYHSGS